jgi:hypothetical protein
MAHSDRVQALIIQNAVAPEDGRGTDALRHLLSVFDGLAAKRALIDATVISA